MAKAGRTYVNQSISFPPHLLQRARDRAERLGLRFSPYVQKCIEADIERGGAIQYQERDPSQLVAAEKAGSYEGGTARRKGRKKSA